MPLKSFAFFLKYGIIVRLKARNHQKNRAGVAQLAEQLICNQQVVGSIPITSSIRYSPLETGGKYKLHTGRFQSGQMDQTVNLTSTTSVVRIYLFPPPSGTLTGAAFGVGKR